VHYKSASQNFYNQSYNQQRTEEHKTSAMELIPTTPQEQNTKKRKREEPEVTEQVEERHNNLHVLVVSLKEEPNFFYVPINEYKKHKNLLRSLALMDLEDDELEKLEKRWDNIFEEWYNKFCFNGAVLNVKKKDITIVKVIKLVDY